MQSPGFIHADHPEHGQPVVYTPGEQLPGWLTAAVESGEAELIAGDGVLMLRRTARKTPPAGRTTRPKETTT